MSDVLRIGLLTTAWLVAATAVADAVEWSGYVSLEPRVFVDRPLFITQPEAGLSPSIVLAPEFRLEWNNGDDRFTVAPYVRWDADDDERSHADLREALWQGIRGPWTWQVGLGRVFWGVTESRHLVDIVNQTDWVEDIDEEDKLGQPMIAFERWTSKAGSFSLFALPGFRERPFPAADARLRGVLPVKTERAEYESAAGNRRLDWAGRWANAMGGWDVGISGFYGTAREPRLPPGLAADGQPVLIPHYDVIGQVGVDVQYTRDAWLWKLEAISRHGQGKPFAAVVAGFEYTRFGLAGGNADLGLLLEYLYDRRDNTAPPTIYDDDWFLGFRLGLNDTQGTAILGGAIVDDDGTFVLVEAQRRLGQTWTIELEARWFLDINPADPILAGFHNDSFFTLRLARYL